MPNTSLRTILRWVLASAILSLAVSGGYAYASHPAKKAAKPNKVLVLVDDNMQRYVAHGLGRAPLGGAYTVTSAARASVRPGSARIVPVAAKQPFVADLGSVRAGDVTMRVTMTLPALPGTGWVDADTQTRLQSNGDAFIARARILPNGHVWLSTLRVVNGHSSTIDNDVQLNAVVVPGHSFVLEAAVSGTTNSKVSARFWSTGSRVPAWRLSHTVSVKGPLAAGGAVGTLISVPPQAQAVPLLVNKIRATGTAMHKVAGTKPTPPHGHSTDPSSAPTSTAPTSTAPTSSAPTSSAPTSSAPTSTDPTSTDPTSTAPTSSAPTSADPTSTAPTDPTSTDPTSTDPTSTTPTPTPTPTPTSPTTQAGAQALGTTTYAVPNNAIVVSPSGSDSAAGTLAAPLRTLGAAIQKARTGATIVLRGGDYNESVSVPSYKTVTIQSYPLETVWLNGATTVSGWEDSGSTWTHNGWTAQFNSSAATNGGYVGSANPMAGHPDQMWMDGTELTQVGSARAVTAGTFYVNYATQQLVVGSNPNGHTMTASNQSIALTVGSPNSTVRGIGVRNYADSILDLAALRMSGTHATLENDVIVDNATTGAALVGTHGTVTHCTMQGNGLLGMVVNYADGSTIDSVLSTGNNTQSFNRAPVSGGIKITRTRGVEVTNSILSANNGPGLWMDESTYQSLVIGNQMTNNIGHGISLEISDTSTIADNVITGNGGDGVKINDSGNVNLWNNTISGRTDVEMVEDLRRNANLHDPGHDPRQAQPDPTMPWIVNHIVVANNVLEAPLSGGFHIRAIDASGHMTAAQMHIQVNGNVFGKAPHTNEFSWSLTPARSSVFTTVSQYTTATGDGNKNIETNGDPNVAAATSGRPVTMPGNLASALADVLGGNVNTNQVGTF